jgi:hypothetical protein
MSALEEPSPKTTRPLTPSCRPAAPVCRLLSPTASYCPARLSGACEVSFLPREPESSHRPLVLRSHLPVTRRWRNDSRRLLSCQLPCEPPLMRPAVSALRTRRLATPDRVTHHASSVTIRRDACAPFRSNTGFTQHLCGACGRLRASPLRPSQPTRCRGEPPSPASADSTACSRLGRPSTACLATRREARPRCVPTDFCFPLLRLRAPAPHRFPASLRSLRFALGRWACTHDQETGGPGVFTTPDPLRRAARVGTRVLFRLLPNEPYL